MPLSCWRWCLWDVGVGELENSRSENVTFLKRGGEGQARKSYKNTTMDPPSENEKCGMLTTGALPVFLCQSIYRG
ncbi:hypothetical protein [Bartonella acomydis]|uniref:hypothetical protein n=1 Tax=Bartonella acomydis TaxID=686234 RepID=UPI0031F057CB